MLTCVIVALVSFVIGAVVALISDKYDAKNLDKKNTVLDHELTAARYELEGAYSDLNVAQRNNENGDKYVQSLEHIIRDNNERAKAKYDNIVRYYNAQLTEKTNEINRAQHREEHLLSLAEVVVVSSKAFENSGNIYDFAQNISHAVKQFKASGPQDQVFEPIAEPEQDSVDFDPDLTDDSDIFDGSGVLEPGDETLIQTFPDGQQVVVIENAEQFADVIALVGANDGDVVKVNDLNFADKFMREVLVPAKIAAASERHTATEAQIAEQEWKNFLQQNGVV